MNCTFLMRSLVFMSANKKERTRHKRNTKICKLFPAIFAQNITYSTKHTSSCMPALEVTPGKHKSCLGLTKKVLGHIPGAVSLSTHLSLDS